MHMLRTLRRLVFYGATALTITTVGATAASPYYVDTLFQWCAKRLHEKDKNITVEAKKVSGRCIEPICAPDAVDDAIGQVDCYGIKT